MSLGNNTSGMIMLEAKVITNHGMICTKTRVFKVAAFVFFEVSPIHIPNQLKAQRFAKKVMLAPNPMAAGTTVSETVVVVVPVALVEVITVTFVVAALVPTAAGGVVLILLKLAR